MSALQVQEAIAAQIECIEGWMQLIGQGCAILRMLQTTSHCIATFKYHTQFYHLARSLFFH